MNSQYIYNLNKDEIDDYTQNKKLFYIFIILFKISLIVTFFYRNYLNYVIIFVLFCINCYLIYNMHCFRNIFDGITNDNYKIIQINKLLTNDECDDIINLSNNYTFNDSETMSEYGNVTTNYRKSTQIWLNDSNPIVHKLSKLSNIITNYPIENMEELQYVYYDTSGYFKEHYDPEPSKNTNIKDRIFTIIFYLNDVEDGGETYFKNIDTYIKPQKGDCVIFKSLLSNGQLLTNSLHQGMPVKKGNKIICNKWIHIHKFNK